MKIASAHILPALLVEKMRMGFANIDRRYEAQTPEMKRALSDYKNAYSFYYSGDGSSDLIQTVKKNVAFVSSRTSVLIVKTGLILSQHKLTAQEQDYMNEIFTIVDAANIYLQAGDYEEYVLILLIRVLNHYCDGRDYR